MNNDFLTFENIKTLVTETMPNLKSEIICNILKKTCIIFNGCLYQLQENITYTIDRKIDIKTKLIKLITLLLEQSFNNLSPDRQSDLKQMFRENDKKNCHQCLQLVQ
jgi:hypothetical protein